MTIDIRGILDAAVAESGVAGAQLSLVRAESVDHAAAGESDARTGTPFTVDTPVAVGSFSKVLTAALAHSLADDGALDLGAPLAGLVPAFAPDDPLAAAITARHAMSMSSGLDTGPYVDWPDDPDLYDRYLGLLTGSPLLFEPGTAFAYSGSGVVLLARACEIAGGGRWADLVRDRVLAHAGLRHTSVETGLAAAPGHTPRDGGGFDTDDGPGWLAATAPTGSSMVSTAHDLAVFGAHLAATVAPGTGMHAPTTPVGAQLVATSWCLGPYSRGVVHPDGRALDIVGHGGRWKNGVCDVVWIPQLGASLAVTTNTPSRAGALIQAVSRAVLPALAGPAAWVEPRVVPTPDVGGLVGSYRSPAADFEVTEAAGGIRLTVRRHPLPGTFDAWGETDQVLYPIGDGRFLPREQGPVERRLQEVWFSAGDRPEFVYDGLAAGRRVE